MNKDFTAGELKLVKAVDLATIAENFGYTIITTGQNHSLKEMGSIQIYNRTNWYRWLNQKGGSHIGFLQEISNIDKNEAIDWLLDFTGHKMPFKFPAPAQNNKLLYEYLNVKRRISIAVIDYFVNKGLIYESHPHHNIVFAGKNAGGVARYAQMRGTGSIFRWEVAGSNKNYCFNIANPGSDHLNIFKAGIDLMSYTELFEDYWTNKLALGMSGDAPIDTFLREHPHIASLNLCMGTDELGRKTAEMLHEKYEGLGYLVTDNTTEISYKDYKDYNDWLVVIKSGPMTGTHESSGKEMGGIYEN